MLPTSKCWKQQILARLISREAWASGRAMGFARGAVKAVIEDVTLDLRRHEEIDGKTRRDAATDFGSADLDQRPLDDVLLQVAIGRFKGIPGEVPARPSHDHKLHLAHQGSRVMPRRQLPYGIPANQPADLLQTPMPKRAGGIQGVTWPRSAQFNV